MKETDQEYILNRIGFDNMGTESTCWEWKGCKDNGWKGCKDNGGYGLTTSTRGEWKAHRLSYSAFVGPIPKGMCVCHSCDNPGCVNPNHLWLGTKKDNIQDMIFKHRQVRVRGEAHGQHKLTEQQIREIRQTYNGKRERFARKYGVHPSNITYILQNRTWKDIK